MQTSEIGDKKGSNSLNRKFPPQFTLSAVSRALRFERKLSFNIQYSTKANCTFQIWWLSELLLWWRVETSSRYDAIVTDLETVGVDPWDPFHLFKTLICLLFTNKIFNNSLLRMLFCLFDLDKYSVVLLLLLLIQLVDWWIDGWLLVGSRKVEKREDYYSINPESTDWTFSATKWWQQVEVELNFFMKRFP